MVEEGVSYEIVAYSYYNETVNYPVTTNINSSNQLLWGKSAAKVITQADPSVSITMTQRFAQVKVSISAASMVHFNITAIGTVTITSGGNRCNLTEHSGELVAGTPPATQTVSGWTPNLPSSVITSAPRTIYPVATGSSTTVTVGGLAIDGMPYSYSNIISTFSQELLGGHSYTLTLDFQATRWAGSNIYWDGSKMTFYPAGHVGPENFYQGLFFKWGSMIGIATGNTANGEVLVPATTSVYYPTGPNATDWSGGFLDYTSIQALSGTISSPGPSNDYVTTMAFDYTNKFGDICRRINSDYRLPRSEEFGETRNVANSLYRWSGTLPADSLGWYRGLTNGGGYMLVTGLSGATGSSDGKFSLNLTYGGNARNGFATYLGGTFPFAGYIDSSGLVNYMGSWGTYLSSSAQTGNWCFHILADAAGIYLNGQSYRTEGYSIRCIKNN
jgi:hypothetical protein